MKVKPVYIIAVAAIALLLFIPGSATGGGLFTAATAASAGSAADQINAAVDSFLSQWEGFSPTPYFDVTRYSWGYGTAAPGATGTITQAQALSDTNAVLQTDLITLQQMITAPLTANQWAALLSFSYNLGVADAENLVPNINSGDSASLQAEWMQYVNSGGAVNQDLVARRAAEWQLWNS